jgi:hypothetical protein
MSVVYDALSAAAHFRRFRIPLAKRKEKTRSIAAQFGSA